MITWEARKKTQNIIHNAQFYKKLEKYDFFLNILLVQNSFSRPFLNEDNTAPPPSVAELSVNYTFYIFSLNYIALMSVYVVMGYGIYALNVCSHFPPHSTH